MTIRHRNCPRCGLSIRVKVEWLSIEHCPRCMARSRVAVDMFTSTLPASELYGAEGVSDGGRPRSLRGDDPAAGLGRTG